MKITEDIYKALREVTKERGGQAELASRSGVSKENISMYLAGKIQDIRLETWQKLEPHLRKHLPASFVSVSEDRAPYNGRHEPSPVLYAPSPASGTVSNTPVLRQVIIDRMAEKGLDYIALTRLTGYDKPHTLERLLEGRLDWFPEMLSSICTTLDLDFDTLPISRQERTMLHPAYAEGMQTRPVWVFSLAQACSAQVVNGVIEPDSGWQLETVPCPVDGRAYIGFKIEGQSMEPKIFDGDTILCDKNAEIKNGDIVVCKFDTTVVCKRYRKFGDTVLLESLNTGVGREFEIKASEIEWIMKAVKRQGDL